MAGRRRSSALRAAGAGLAVVACLFGGLAARARWSAPAGTGPPGEAAAAPAAVDAEARIDDLVRRMTLEEKVDMLGGAGYGPGLAGMTTRFPERLGVPNYRMTDGPAGVRWERATAFPAAVCLAAAFDPDLAEAYGRALARETKGRGRNVILGPCVNIHRAPYGGRNFESFGEDPHLAARTAVAYIRGVQGESVVAVVKHLAANNQEFERRNTDVAVDERALNEIYLPAFRAAVREAGVWAVMGAYNKLGGDWCCENRALLTDILKESWGFRGFVVSDWDAVHGGLKAARAGLDLEMPSAKGMNRDLVAAVRRGDLAETAIDDKVRRLLRPIFALDLFDTAPPPIGFVNSLEHRDLAREIAAAGMVLLKNERGALPIDTGTVRTIAVIGPNAEFARTGGGGSSLVVPFSSVSPLEGIRRAAGGVVRIVYELGSLPEESRWVVETSALFPPDGRPGEHGLRGEYFPNRDLAGNPAVTRVDSTVGFDWGDGPPAPGLPADHFSVRWTGRLVPPRTGEYRLTIASDDGLRLFLDGRNVLDHWGNHGLESRKATLRLVGGRSYDLRLEYFEGDGEAVARFGWLPPGEAEALRRRACEAARAADVAVVCAGLNRQVESEDYDHAISLPEGQDELIEAVAAANPRTVVVMNSGAAVLMGRWVDRVAAVLQAWYPGEQGGHAIALLLFGAANPSGRLPTTFLRSEADAACRGHYPGANGSVAYAEGVLVGYRHFDARGIEPLFPFGHGLSYTTFAYANLALAPLPGGACDVSFEVANTGARAGAEVAQVYVGDVEASLMRPPKELKAFLKVPLEPGETKTVRLRLGPGAFSFYDPSRHDWVLEPGAFRILVGASSRDIRLIGACDITEGGNR